MIERLRRRLRRIDPKAARAYAVVALLSFVLGAVTFCSGSQDHSGHEAATNAHAEHGADVEPAASTWTCAMHPQIRQPEPGQCPICGMDLIPVEAQGDHDAPAERVVLSERAQALARLRTAEVRRQADPSTDVRLLGRVEPDERTSRLVTAWVGGRIERLHVRVTGEQVRAGQVIATLYSPEVFAAHQDLIVAKRQVLRMQSASDMARTAAEAALDAARDRLKLLGVAPERLAAMESENEPARQMAIRTPFAGTVLERLASEGAYVTTGEPLYRIADLSRVWVQLDAYERDLPTLLVGQNVQVSLEALPGDSFEGKVAFIEPTVDPERRTARVRIEVANKGGRLRPGMFAQAVVHGQAETSAERPLVVPHTAPLFTGRRSVVYVEVPRTERPTYEARIVRLGPRAGDYYPVVAGLAEGERIVVRGAFVLDADLQIRGGASMMTGPDDTDDGPWDQAIELSAAERRKFQPVLGAYLELQKALASDKLEDAKKAAESLVQSVGAITLEQPAVARDAWPPLARELRRHAEHIARADTFEGARGGFEELTAWMKVLVRRFGNPLDGTLQIAFCPMASGRGAIWLQQGSEIENPYYGHQMRDCGELRETLPPGTYLPQPVTPSRPSPAPAPEGHQH